MTEHKNLTAALAAFQADLPDVSKGSTNPAFKSKYADLADVVKVVLPKLAEHGLAWVTAPDITEHGPVLRYELRHVSGESITGAWPLPDGAKAQEIGSWITYGRRYTLGAVTGIAPDEDDDGNAAQKAPAASRRPKVTAEQALSALAQTKTLADVTEWWAKVGGYGLAGVAKIKEAHEARKAELAGTETAPLVDHWAVAEIPK